MPEKVESFEDLNVYKQTRELTNNLYAITKEPAFCKDYGLVDQIRRASVSIISNIAEGFERGNNTEFIYFLSIAKGSCGEVRAQLTVALDQKYIDKNIYDELVDRCRRISGMLNNLIAYLKGSKFKGLKFKRPPIKPWAEQVKEMLEKARKNP
ncbi:MAG: four helix bundle protein [Planctomycetota bacterium]|nr:four helix bundle protein [Planctomycetota bacterium]